MPPPTSKAWNYFKRTANSKTVTCKLCETELTYTGGTTNMLNHLRLKHNTGIEHETLHKSNHLWQSLYDHLAPVICPVLKQRS